ncbi:MAG: alkaline phosphatase family protein [Barnesiella sp.]|nr:alkaline phosphatase family protein [Bacteroidales bacterium]MBD5247044.1 alkaline phosphatase family protein [Barnesiella sp.]
MSRPYKSLSIKLVGALVAASAVLPLSAQTSLPRRPKLVVGIVINGLDIDKVYQLREHFTSGGFNKLLDKGVTFTNINYGSPLDDAAATAVIMTGASPAVNGIAASEVYDFTSRSPRPVLLDAATIGNFTDETYSPKSLRVSTLADELRIDTSGLGMVHAVSPDATTSIIMAGHAGNSACWIADKTGKWASSTYYTELPTSIQQLNHMRPLSTRLDTIRWSPTLPEAAYSELPSHKKIYSFNHTFNGDTDRYTRYKLSAPVNDEVTSVSLDFLKLLNMGKREPVDMLEVNYTVQPYTYSGQADTRVEQLDSYLRLDRDLARLFDAIESQGPGLDKTLVWVAGTPASNAAVSDEERWNIPGGEFSADRAVSLLKVNLMSIYGNGDWVTGYYNNQIYLNRDLIQQRGKDLNEIRRESADFLRRMTGVTYAVTIDQAIAANESADSPFPPARNIDIDTAGDVLISVAPGWQIVQNANSAHNKTVERARASNSAAFIMHPDVDARIIDTPVDARVVAPTVARLLRIRSPNGGRLAPVRL